MKFFSHGSADVALSSTLQKRVVYEDLEQQFFAWQCLAGSVPFVSCFGRSSANLPALRSAEEIGSLIIARGYGVLHGGYTGMMQAVSEGANRMIRAHDQKGPYAFRNIGVPLDRFDNVCVRTKSLHLPMATTIWDRRRAITELGDIALVLPAVGIGTFAEMWDVLHENYLSEDGKRKSRPLIFFGSEWRGLLQQIQETFQCYFSSHLQKTLFFVSTNIELEYVLDSFRERSFLEDKKKNRHE